MERCPTLRATREHGGGGRRMQRPRLVVPQCADVVRSQITRCRLVVQLEQEYALIIRTHLLALELVHRIGHLMRRARYA